MKRHRSPFSRTAGIAVLLLSFTAGLVAQPTGYAYRKLIRLNASQISGSTAHTDFPVLISLIHDDLRTEVNGGGMENPSGYDITFTLDDGSSLLDHELQSYTASTGELICWVRISSLSPSADTDIYLYFGNPDIFTDQSSTATWSSAFLSVWHLDDFQDATANAHTLTNNGTATGSSGQIGAARSFAGTGDDLTDPTGGTYLNGFSDLTVSLWAKADAVGSDRGLIYGDDPNGNDDRLMIRHDAAGGSGGGTNVFRTNVAVGSSLDQILESSNNSQSTNWQYIVLTRVPGSKSDFYLDGALETPSYSNKKNGTLTDNTKLVIGKGGKDGPSSSWDGLIDEVRIANVARDADWIASSYNNMNDPSSFHSVIVANELPVLAGIEGSALTYQSQSGAEAVTLAMTVQDYNDIYLDSALVTISSNYQAGEDTLAFTSAYGISAVWNPGAGALRLSGTAKRSEYETSLHTVTYENTSASPDMSVRTIQYQVHDGNGFSNTQTRDINISVTNNAPVLSGIEGTTISYPDSYGDTTITATLAVSDLDDTLFVFLTFGTDLHKI